MKEFVVTWSIENFSYSWHKTGELIISPFFFAAPMQNSAWFMGLYPRGTKNSDYLSLFLYRMEDHVLIDVAFNFEFSCISEDASVLHSSLIPETFINFAPGGKEGFGEPHFMQRHVLFGERRALYLPNDTLTLRCKMWKNEGSANEFGQVFRRTLLITEKIITVGNINTENETEKTFYVQSKSQKEEFLSVSVLYLDDAIDVEINPISQENIKFSTLKFSLGLKRSGRKLCELMNNFFGILDKEKWRLPFTSKLLPTENINSAGNEFEFIIDFVYSTGESNPILEEGCSPEKNSLSKNSEFVSSYMMSCLDLTDSPSLSEDLRNLYVEQVLCDVKLKTQTKTFFAHKFVLCARSSVFMSMLTHDMKEKLNSCIDIGDISDDTLEIFLIYLYTDDFKDLEWNAVINLYYAADEYQVERLKLLCRSYFLENLDDNNFCELLILADRHYDCELKLKVDDFIWKNEEKVFRSSKWKEFAHEHQQLAMQTMLLKYEEKEKHDSSKTHTNKLSSVPSIRDDFRSLYQGHIACDVKVKSKGATIPAHKIVLCASSLIFRNDLRDKSTDLIEMADWDGDIVSRMLLFLYNDSLEDIHWDIALKLYQVAKAYQIKRLRVKCSCFLLENLKVSNASKLLLLAHEYSDVKIKSVVEDFILFHDVEIFGSDDWAEFSKANLLLANEIMLAKYKKMK